MRSKKSKWKCGANGMQSIKENITPILGLVLHNFMKFNYSLAVKNTLEFEPFPLRVNFNWNGLVCYILGALYSKIKTIFEIAVSVLKIILFSAAHSRQLSEDGHNYMHSLFSGKYFFRH